jgi:hypothetical protein
MKARFSSFLVVAASASLSSANCWKRLIRQRSAISVQRSGAVRAGWALFTGWVLLLDANIESK